MCNRKYFGGGVDKTVARRETSINELQNNQS